MIKKYLDIIILAFLFVIITYGIVAYIELRGQGIACQNDPFKFAAAKASDLAGSPLMCSCNFESGNFLPFFFNQNGISPNQISNNTGGSQVTVINTSLFFEELNRSRQGK